MEKVLVTGSSGFIGNHLIRKLMAENFDFSIFNGDLTSFENVKRNLIDSNITHVIHLAGMSNVAACEASPDKAFAVNVLGTFNILEYLKMSNRQVKFIFASTGQVYKVPTETQKIIFTEGSPTEPKNTYSRTKLMAEKIVSQYFKDGTMGTGIIFRLFNHTHKTQQGNFFFPQLYEQLGKGLTEIKVGNLDLYRDFNTVNDLTNLFIKALRSSSNSPLDIFNICSGNPRSLRDLAEELARQMGINTKFVTDNTRLRNNDPYSILGSSDKAQNTFNWKPCQVTDKEFVKIFLADLN